MAEDANAAISNMDASKKRSPFFWHATAKDQPPNLSHTKTVKNLAIKAFFNHPHRYYGISSIREVPCQTALRKN